MCTSENVTTHNTACPKMDESQEVVTPHFPLFSLIFPYMGQTGQEFLYREKKGKIKGHGVSTHEKARIYARIEKLRNLVYLSRTGEI